MSDRACGLREDHGPHSWGDLEWRPGIEADEVGKWWGRYDLEPGEAPPPGWAQDGDRDETTGKWRGSAPIDQDPGPFARDSAFYCDPNPVDFEAEVAEAIAARPKAGDVLKVYIGGEHFGDGIFHPREDDEARFTVTMVPTEGADED